MATKTFMVAAGQDGNYGALVDGVDQTAATRTDGWTSAKIASTNAADFDAATKQSSGTFSAASGKPSAIITGTTANAFKSPAALNGTFANTSWSLTFAVRASTASSQAGRMRLRVYKATNAAGTTGVVELTGSTQIGTTSSVLSTSADVTTVVTWTPGATINLANEFLFFVIAWEITTAGGSNSADVQIRTGQAAGGSRFVTPDFVAAQTVTIGSRGAGTTVLGVTLSASGTATKIIGTRAAATTVRGVTLVRETRAFTIGKVGAATTVRGVAVVPAARQFTIGTIFPYAAYGTSAYGQETYAGVYVYGVTPVSAGFTMVIGTRAAATTVRGVTASATGAVALPIGKVTPVTVVRGLSIISLTIPVPLGRRAAATTVRGITLAPTGAPIVSIGTRAQATNVRGIALTPAGTVPLTIGSRAAATTVRGVALAATGTVIISIGRRAAATTVPGITVISQPLGVPIGRRASTSIARGVTLSATGAAPLVIGSRAAATTVRGLTLNVSGLQTAAIGKRASATTVRGVTLTPTGVAPLAVGRRASLTIVFGVSLRGIGTVPVTVGRVAPITIVFGVTVTPTGAVPISIGRVVSVPVVYGVALFGALIRQSTMHRLTASEIVGIQISSTTDNGGHILGSGELVTAGTISAAANAPGSITSTKGDAGNVLATVER